MAAVPLLEDTFEGGGVERLQDNISEEAGRYGGRESTSEACIKRSLFRTTGCCEDEKLRSQVNTDTTERKLGLE